MQTNPKAVTKDDVQYILNLMSANNLRSQIEEDKPDAPFTQSQIDFIVNHASVKDHKEMTQDEMKQAMKIYLNMIKHDANEYINNADINLGELDYEYDTKTCDTYADDVNSCETFSP